MTSETVSPLVSSRWRTICASPLAPKKIKTATRASRMSPLSNPMRKKAAAKTCPMVEEMFVARTAPRRVASSPRKILPPSSGKAGRRLKTARTAFRKPREKKNWTSDGYLDLICRLLREGLQIGDTAYGQKRYAVNLEAKALSYQGVAELVQQHAQEQRHYHNGGCERPEWATRRLVADKGEEGQEQEEGPVHPHVYTRDSSYLESTAHEVTPVRSRD